MTCFVFVFFCATSTLREKGKQIMATFLDKVEILQTMKNGDDDRVGFYPTTETEVRYSDTWDLPTRGGGITTRKTT